MKGRKSLVISYFRYRREQTLNSFNTILKIVKTKKINVSTDCICLKYAFRRTKAT